MCNAQQPVLYHQGQYQSDGGQTESLRHVSHVFGLFRMFFYRMDLKTFYCLLGYLDTLRRSAPAYNVNSLRVENLMPLYC